MRLTTPTITGGSLSILSALLPVPLAALAVAYLWTLSQRPGVPERFQLEDPHQHGFPAWYGRSRSPVDHVTDRAGRAGKGRELCDEMKSVLVYVDLPYDSHFIPGALSSIASLQSDPSVNLTIVSPFSDTWNETLSIAVNLEQAGCGEVDYLWRIGEGASEQNVGCEGSVWISEILGGEAADRRANVTLLTHPQQVLSGDNRESRDEDMGLIGHIPPVADPMIFYPSKHLESRTSVVYFPHPRTASRDYPSLPWGKDWSIYTPSKRTVPHPQGEAFGKSRWRRYWEKEERRLSATMRQAGICLFEGWEDGLVDDRMVKAMLSGCVVAGVIPHSDPESLAPALLALPRPIQSSDPISHFPADLPQLIRQISTAELEQKASRGFVLARQRFIAPARNEGVWQLVQMWKDGGRGYHFTHGFRWDCHGKDRAGWCESKDKTG